MSLVSEEIEVIVKFEISPKEDSKRGKMPYICGNVIINCILFFGNLNYYYPVAFVM